VRTVGSPVIRQTSRYIVFMQPSTSPAIMREPRIRLGILLRRSQQTVFRALTAQLEPLGIRGDHFRVLLQLDEHGPSSQTDLAKSLGTDLSNVFRTFDDLHSMNAVTRRAGTGERREHVLALTYEGRVLLGRATQAASAVAHRLTEGSTDEEVAQLTAVLERFLARHEG
jgi:MarR family transcriptional regulator, lower aerobic nicotinate degradation pathway regulator